MAEEAPILGRQDRGDELLWKVVERDGIDVADAAASNRDAIPIEERDRVVALVTPIDLGCLHRRECERQEQQRPRARQREPFAERLDDRAPPARGPEPSEGAIEAAPFGGDPRGAAMGYTAGAPRAAAAESGLPSGGIGALHGTAT